MKTQTNIALPSKNSSQVRSAVPQTTRSAVTAALACVVFLLAASDAAAQTTIPRDKHCWGRFEAGSWKRVRVINEEYGDGGKVIRKNVSEARTVLVSSGETNYSLQVEVLSDPSGRQRATRPQLFAQNYNGAQSGQAVHVHTIGSSNLSINGRTIPCEMKQVTIDGRSTNVTSRIYYSNEVEPHILKSETVATDAVGGSKKQETVVDVVAVDRPYESLGQNLLTTYVRTVQKSTANTRTTLEVQSSSIPGTVVSRKTTELDSQGRVLRKSTIELLEYHVVLPEASKGAQGRRRWRDRIRGKR